MKERVSLSKRPLKDGVVSLFLDYRIGGQRRRENLKLYLVAERTHMDKVKNIETMRIAKAVRERREFELEQVDAGLEVKARPQATTFAEYSKAHVSQYKNINTKKNCRSTMDKVNKFFPGVLLHEMNTDFFRRLVAKLEEEGLKINSIRKAVVRTLTILREAKDDGMIQDVPRLRGIMPKPETTIRECLTIDELRKLDATPCRKEEIKKAFLFACFTGLRFSDIVSLTPSAIKDGYVAVRQVKTNEPVIVPISENAARYLPDLDPNAKKVYHIYSNNKTNAIVQEWANAAGVDKHVTFHVSRHTFATLALDNGAELLTVSRLLGHTSIVTTTIYTKSTSKAKQKAVDAIPKI